MESNTNTEKLVERIISLIEEGNTDSEIIEKLESKFTFTDCDAELALELVRTGLFRASFTAKGQTYPKNNLSDNPIVIAAIKIGLEKLEVEDILKKDIPKNKPWWKFW